MKPHKSNKIAEELAQVLLRFKKFGPQHKESRLGVRPSEFVMLAILVHSKEYSANGAKSSELSAQMKITPAAVSHLINSLAIQSYVERLDDASDRRIVLIKPTEKAKEKVDSIVLRLVKKCEGLAESIGEKDTLELIRLLGLAFDFLLKSEE
jgi:DNA-binding MarR family transcriptional regulator